MSLTPATRRLPGHLRGDHGHGRVASDEEYFGPTNPYWDGRYHRPHDNSYHYEERSAATVLAMLEEAMVPLRALVAAEQASGLNGESVVAEEQAENLRRAEQCLSQIDHHLPDVECWVVYRVTPLEAWAIRPTFGFLDLEQALDWASWAQDTNKYGEQLYVTRGHQNLNMVIDPRADLAMFKRTY